VLVANDDDVLDRELAKVIVLVDPVVQVVEGVDVRDVEHEDAAVSATVVRRCKSSKAFLACSVPHLDADA